MALVGNLLYMVALLGLGVAGRRVGLLTPTRRDRLTTVAFNVVLPALVFTSTAGQSLGAVLSASLVVGLWLVLAVMVAVSLVVHRSIPSARSRSVAVVQSYHANLGFLGLPVVAVAFGDLTTAKASVLLGVGALTQVPLTVSLLTGLTGADATLRHELRDLLANPVILALLAGLAASGLGLSVPASVAAGLELLASTALPIALLCVGGALSVDVLDADRSTVGSVVALKVLVMPVVAVVVFSLVSDAASTLRAGAVMLAMPTAVSTYIYAGEFGCDDQLASLNVFATTVASLVTVLLVVRLLGVL